MLQMNKRELREKYLNERNNIPAERAAKLSGTITDNLTALPWYLSADTVLIFVSVGSEPDTGELISRSLALGKTVAVPFIKEREMIFLRIGSVYDLVPGAYSIPTAPPESPEITDFENCFCAVPCLAVDSGGRRLGYGGGYYDRFLKKHPDLFTAAVCFDSFVADELPHEDHDIKVRLIVTESRVQEV